MEQILEFEGMNKESMCWRRFSLGNLSFPLVFLLCSFDTVCHLFSTNNYGVDHIPDIRKVLAL